MRLEEKVGALFMFGFGAEGGGTEVTDNLRLLIERYHVGGVIYFLRNVESARQTASLSERIQELARRSGQRLPVLIAVDQEGGRVARMEYAATFPGSMALGAVGSPEVAYRVGRVIGRELSAVGVNVNLAPVLDVNTNPGNPVIHDRSFGDEPEAVSRLGLSYARGLQDAGVAAVAKHFPGYGAAPIDPHFAPGSIDLSREELARTHVEPFRRAVEAGVDAVMTSHMIYPALDPESPGTLSRRIVSGSLRGELGFGGVVITDCMEMEAIGGVYPAGESAVRALKAGVDIVLFSHTLEKQIEAYESALKAVERGELSERDLDEKVGRVLELRSRLRVSVEPSIAGSEEHRRFELEVAGRALTLLKNDGVLPLSRGVPLVSLDPRPVFLTRTEERQLKVGWALREKGFAVTPIDLEPSPPASAAGDVLRALEGAPVLVAGVNASAHVDLLNEVLRRSARRSVAVFLGNPFLVNRLDVGRVGAVVLAYSQRPCSVRAAAEVLAGEARPGGALPVRLEKFDRGWGLRGFAGSAGISGAEFGGAGGLSEEGCAIAAPD